MKFLLVFIAVTLSHLANFNTANASIASGVKYERFKINSHRDGLSLVLHQYKPNISALKGTILFLHGSSFPSKLSFGFKLEGESWQDYLNAHGYSVYMLDFLGYGDSDRYPEMKNNENNHKPIGTLPSAVTDLKSTVKFILKKDHLNSIHLVGHSWGSAVAASYAQFHSEEIESLILYASIYQKPSEMVKPSQNEARLSTYQELQAESRLRSLESLAPGEPLLAKDMYNSWTKIWLKSETLVQDGKAIRYPTGPMLDVRKLRGGKLLYNPEKIKSDTLIIRGEYDRFPTNQDAYHLFESLTSVTRKQYVTIGEGTHVMHLEKNRRQLYQQVLSFISK